MVKKFILTLIWTALISQAIAQNQPPFNKGFNFAKWFEVSDAHKIDFTRFAKDDFTTVKNMGCDVVRLPVRLHDMTSGAPDYVLDPLLIDLLDSVANWAEELELYLILDNHSFDPLIDTDPSVEEILKKVWPQVAQRFKMRSQYVLYEILNEPHGIDGAIWGQIQGEVVDTIRTIDATHTIIVGGHDWNSYASLSDLPVYDDDNLIYTFHFYEPFIFTQQAAEWTDLAQLNGLPFPYDPGQMPSLPPELVGTWVEDAFLNYSGVGTTEYMENLLDEVVQFREQRNAPVYCGEFGVEISGTNNSSRVAWTKAVREYLEENNIPWTMWEYADRTGIFDYPSAEMPEHDLNENLVANGLGLIAPAQLEYIHEPTLEEFVIYDDFFGKNINPSEWLNTGSMDYFGKNAAVGEYCLHWSNISQWDAMTFDFVPDKDLSAMLDEDYVVEARVKGALPEGTLNIRFVDSDTGDNDHPWRMGINVDDSHSAWDNEWRVIEIPLAEMYEGGAFEEVYIDPQGKFDWTAVDQFVIDYTATNENAEFWFDHIRVKKGERQVDGEEEEEEEEEQEDQVTAISSSEKERTQPLLVYPNPVSDQAFIDYYVAKRGPASVSLENLLGQRLEALVDKIHEPGRHSLIIDGDQFSSGVYLIKLRRSGGTDVRKVIIAQ